MEQQFVGSRLLHEATDMLTDVKAKAEAASTAVAPLTEGKGETFLIANKVLLVCLALKGRMREKSTTLADFMKEMNKGAAGGVSQAAFAEFVEKLPALLQRNDLATLDEERSAMFMQLDADGDGVVNETDFENAFRERFYCTHSIAVTDGFGISTSKTVAKLEVDDVVEQIGEAKKDEENGLTCIKMRSQDGKKEGWVSLQGNQGTTHLEVFSPYFSFVQAIDRQLDELQNS